MSFEEELCSMIAGQDTVDMRNNIEGLRWPLGVPRLDTAPNRALQAVLNELRRQRGSYMFLRVSRRYMCSSESLHAAPPSAVPIVTQLNIFK